jgi:hypothetical protein
MFLDQSEHKPKTIGDLNQLYDQADSVDHEVFAEMRSNLLLIAGDHYNKRRHDFLKRIRDSKDLSDQQKLRLTKNHVQKICKIYANNIVSMAPGVGFEPKQPGEIQDEKAAELHHSVWRDAVDRYKLDEKIDDWVDDFIGLGEVAVKIFYDPAAGEITGEQFALDGEGQYLLDGEGNPKVVPKTKGEFVFETLYGFNLLRDPGAKDVNKSPYLIYRKMMMKDEVETKFPQFKGKIQSSADRTMVVFDPSRGGYRKADNEVLVKEFFFRPCAEYPKGYFYITTDDLILAEGELPGGIFPIVIQAWDKIQTTPRGRSPVKQMRPYQAEINRAASKIAEHQVTLGDDKIIIQNGSKVAAGVAMPGVRSISVTGQAPTILQGRDGSQYLPYMQAQIEELYQVMMVAEDEAEVQGQVDPYALLFRSASQKKKFQRYIKRFERFLVEVCKLYLRLAKLQLPEDEVIYAIGRKEQVNIPEFKRADDISYQIVVSPEADDIETKMGKQLVLNHLVQFTGANLSKEDLGKLIRLMPYANLEEGLEDLTQDYDLASNDILALDRGEMPQINQYDSHVYCLKRAVSRMRSPDFKFLHPTIQQNYQAYVQGHQEAEAENQKQIQMAESGFIPTDGYLVTCQVYVADPENPAKTRLARLPYGALKWLIEKLESQGQSQQELENMNHGALSQMAQMLMNKGMPPGGNGMPQGQPQPRPAQPAQAPMPTKGMVGPWAPKS